MAVTKCEDSVGYLKDWRRLHGLKIEFAKVERLRPPRGVLPDYHAFKLVEPFVEESFACLSGSG